MDNSETLVTFSTQATGQVNVRENRGGGIKHGQFRDTCNIQHTSHRTG